MHAISSYRGNRPNHIQTGPITIHCAAASAQHNEHVLLLGVFLFYVVYILAEKILELKILPSVL